MKSNKNQRKGARRGRNNLAKAMGERIASQETREAAPTPKPPARRTQPPRNNRPLRDESHDGHPSGPRPPKPADVIRPVPPLPTPPQGERLHAIGRCPNPQGYCNGLALWDELDGDRRHCDGQMRIMGGEF